MKNDLDAADVEEATKAEVAAKAQLYAGLYLAAFVACVPASWLPAWSRWPVGALVAACLTSALTMTGRLNTLAQANWFFGYKNVVLRHHRMLNAVAIARLVYSLGAVWARWPLPALAALVAAILNFIHFGGYKAALNRA